MLTAVCTTWHQMKRQLNKNEVERIWKEAIVGSTSLARLRKHTKTLPDSWSPEYETEVLLIKP
jgi:hypothetical protein